MGQFVPCSCTEYWAVTVGRRVPEELAPNWNTRLEDDITEEDEAGERKTVWSETVCLGHHLQHQSSPLSTFLHQTLLHPSPPTFPHQVLYCILPHSRMQIRSTPTPPNSVETLSSLCGWWADTKQDPLPSICHQFVSERLIDHVWSRVPTQLYNLQSVKPLYRHHPSTTESLSSPFGTGRSISIIGILGGVLFILLIVALITCLRRRKRCSSSVDSHTEDLHHVHTLHQVRVSQHLLGLASREAPPDYSTVVKQKEEEEEAGLPSYSQAVGHEEVMSDSSSK